MIVIEFEIVHGQYHTHCHKWVRLYIGITILLAAARAINFSKETKLARCGVY